MWISESQWVLILRTKTSLLYWQKDKYEKDGKMLEQFTKHGQRKDKEMVDGAVGEGTVGRRRGIMQQKEKKMEFECRVVYRSRVKLTCTVQFGYFSSLYKHKETKSDERRTDALCLLCSDHLPVCNWRKCCSLLWYFWSTTPYPAAYWNKQTCYYELSTCATLYLYYNPHLTSFQTLPLTFDSVGFMCHNSVCLWCVWNDKRPNQGPVIWACLESYYWATLVQVNLKYTGTSIYIDTFILSLMVKMVSLDIGAYRVDVSSQQWDTSGGCLELSTEVLLHCFSFSWMSFNCQSLKRREMNLGLVSEPDSPSDWAEG